MLASNTVSFDIVYHQDVIAHQAMRRRRASRAARGAGANGSGVADAAMDRDMVPRADGQPHVRHDHGPGSTVMAHGSHWIRAVP